MKCIRLHLLLSALLLISVSAFAGPRSFRQAKQIAERQAALLGIVMDESAASQAKSFGFGDKTQKSQASDQETASYYVFPHGEGKGFTIVCRKSWVIPIRELMMRHLFQKVIRTS